MNRYGQMLSERYERMTPREKAIVLAGGVLVALLIGFSLMESGWKQGRLLQKQIAQTRAETEAARVQTAEAIRRLAQDPNADVQARIAAVRSEIEKVDLELRAMGRGLVAPNRMASVLRDVLTRNRAVKLLSLRTLPVSSVIEQPPERPAAQIYKHGIELSLQGSYLDLLDYVMRLEQLPVQMFWAQAQMDASDYPRVRLTLVLYTLSLDKDWMVV